MKLVTSFPYLLSSLDEFMYRKNEFRRVWFSWKIVAGKAVIFLQAQIKFHLDVYLKILQHVDGKELN